MKEDTAGRSTPTEVVWTSLENWIRERAQQLLQALLEEEVTTVLGRLRSERRGLSVEPPVYRNGYGKSRRLTLTVGTVVVRRPRLRGLEQPFESRVLPLFKRRAPGVDRLLPELYLHGLATGDFDLALRGLLGDEAPLSASSIARLKAQWETEYETWKARSLREQEVVYVWVDGIYVKAGLEREKAALLVVMGALADGSKVILAVENGYRESTESWAAILRDLQKRGLNGPKLVIGDGHLGLWGALAHVFPAAGEQRCWNHRMVNVLDRVSKKHQPVAKAYLRQLMYAPSRDQADTLKQAFQEWCEQQGCAPAGRLLEEDWDRMLQYYDFPVEHWKHLRTTNPVESPFAAVRLRTSAAKRFKRVEKATVLIWKTLLVVERHFRKLNAPELLADVAAGVRFQDGIREVTKWKSAA